MRTKYNRFAIVPHMCNSCKQFVWLEAYRKADVFRFIQGRYAKENICKGCIVKYDAKDGVVDK